MLYVERESRRNLYDTSAGLYETNRVCCMYIRMPVWTLCLLMGAIAAESVAIRCDNGEPSSVETILKTELARFRSILTLTDVTAAAHATPPETSCRARNRLL